MSSWTFNKHVDKHAGLQIDLLLSGWMLVTYLYVTICATSGLRSSEVNRIVTYKVHGLNEVVNVCTTT